MCIRDRVYTAAIMKGNPEIEEAHRLGIPTVAVSYTHLDVYKRQAMSKLKKLLPKRDLRARWLWVLALALTAVKLGLCSFQLIVASVSYTHLDVYKRQIFRRTFVFTRAV